jgi:nucleoside-diphosphate-sugar epimerase
VFLAGATGALGRALVPVLVEAGHEVVGTTRTPAHLAPLERAGATAVLMDGLDAAAVMSAVREARPDAVVHQLTSLKKLTSFRNMDRQFALTNRLRTEGTDHLRAAAQAVAAKRFVAQSFTGWTNPRSGGSVKTEEDGFDDRPVATSRQTLEAIRYVERAVTSAEGLTGIVLRYGGFYGGESGLSRGGDMLELVHRRRFPVVGSGAGVWSLIHVEDAARATLQALDHGASGVYNIVDDDPAPVAEWLPELAAAVGAPPPRRLPAWLARPVVGAQGVSMMTDVRGSSNAKARRELDWAPRYSSWRDGFRTLA